MPRPSTLVFRRLSAKRKITFQGRVCYADNTPEGSIIDPHTELDRKFNPLTLERFVPPHRATNFSAPLMANPVTPGVWEVVECYADIERAIKGAQRAKKEESFKGYVMRIRDRSTGTYIMVDIL